MRFSDYARGLMALAKAVYQWVGEVTEIDRARRAKVVLYAEEVAATLERAAGALAILEKRPCDEKALLSATRELGRISGYVETIVAAMAEDLDGRRRAGLKRRLERLEPFELEASLREYGAFRHARRLTAAEGFFRALADSLRT